MDVTIVDFAKAIDVVPHSRLLVIIANSRVDTRVVVWVRESLRGRTQRDKVEWELSDEVRGTSMVPEGSVLGPLLFLALVNDIGRNTESDTFLKTV
jgi:hypothetical protein